jgi:uncharacterized protein YbaR (Trm112 family)
MLSLMPCALGRGLLAPLPSYIKDLMDTSISDKLLAILACPKCKAPLIRQQDRLVCTRPECRLRYPIREGIPILLIDEAETPSQS